MNVTTPLHNAMRSARGGRWWPALGAGALVVGVWVVYWPTLSFEYIWDDDTNFLRHPPVLAPDGLRTIWLGHETYQYYPLTFSTWWLEYRLSGKAFVPAVTHAMSIGLHAANAVLVMWLVSELGLRRYWAWFAAGLFALHPVQVESVAWATERKNLLAGLFFFAAFAAYARYLRHARRTAYIASLAAFTLAGLAKSVTMTLTASLALLEWTRSRSVSVRVVLRLIPFAMLSIALAVVARYYEHERAGARGELFSLSAAERVIVASRVPLYYAGRILVPIDASFVPPRWSIDASSAPSYWPTAVLAGIVVAAIVLRRQLPALSLLALGHFLLTLLPASGLVDFYFTRYSFVQDHFQYFAGVGLFILIAQAAGAAARRIGAAPSGALAIVMLVALGVLSRRQGTIYADEETLWKDTLTKNPAATIAHYNLGSLQRETGRFDEALASYEAVLRIDPDDTEARNVLGTILSAMGRDDDARIAYERVLAIDPDDANAHNNLGLLAEKGGRLDEAERLYRRAIELSQTSAAPHYNMGNVYLKRGQPELAMSEYRAAISHRRGFADAHAALGELLQRNGELDEALIHFESAFRAAPTNAVTAYNLATVEARLGRTPAAIEHLQVALSLRPAYPAAALNLSTIHWKAGRSREAVAVLQDARCAAADDLRVSERLAWYLATAPEDSVRDGARAVSLAEQVCKGTNRQDAAALDTLAAAYAEVGLFDDAIRAASEAAAVAAATSPERVAGIEARLSEYRAGLPHREGERQER